MNYENTIEDIEGNSRYSIFIFLAFGFMSFTYSIELNSLIFLSYRPEFHCVDNITRGRNVTWIKDQCHGSIRLDNDSIEEFKCQQWQYTKSVMTRTMVTDLDLVCDREHYATILETTLFVGLAVGYFVGIAGDLLGRKKSILIGVTIEILVNLILPFTKTFWMILILRFLWGLGIFKIFQGLCYMSEIITVQKRSFYINNFWCLYVVGYLLTPMVAFCTRDWRLLRLICNVPLVVYLLYLWIPESPRWLSVVGRHDEAKESLAFIAKKNGLDYCPSRFDTLKVDTETKKSAKVVFKTVEMRKKLLVLILAQSSVSLCYSGLSINAHFVCKDIFLNVFLQGSLEILTGPLGWISSSRWNRRISMTSFLLVTGVCLVVSSLIPLHNVTLTITKAIFAMLGKFMLTSAFCIMDMYLMEVFPTSVRSSTSLIIVGTAGVATVLAPSINRLDKFGSFISSTIYSTMICLSALMIFTMLPETKDCPLPQTIFEADQLRKGNEKVFCQLMLDKETLEHLNSNL